MIYKAFKTLANNKHCVKTSYCYYYYYLSEKII